MQMEVQRQFMLPPTTTPAYSSSSANNQLAFPPLTPASGMSTQELRVPTTYQAGSHTDQRGTPSGTNALNAMYVNTKDRHPRQQSGSDDRHHRDYGSSNGRQHRRDSGSDDIHHRGYGRNDDRHHRGRSKSDDRPIRRQTSSRVGIHELVVIFISQHFQVIA